MAGGEKREWARRGGPLLAVSAVSAWNLRELWAETKPVAFLNDASVHEQMVRFATQKIAVGQSPFTSWFPNVGLGSAQYLHYQSLGSVLTGAAGVLVGANTAFSWSTYLLLSLWPFVVYGSSRLLGLSPLASASAAVLSPFVVSFTGVGYERGAYIWIGGAQVWTQLLGSWALPFAWACTWRAFHRPRWAWAACALVAFTTALHFMSGYLAFLGILVMALAAFGPWRQRLARAVLLGAGSLAGAAWVVVPLVQLSKWSSVNQELAATDYVQGYGAHTELGWLFKGQMFDARRDLPVITVFVLAGAAVALWRARGDDLSRVLPLLFVASLVLSFGPTTWGPLADLVPAHADLYFRRFMMGTQLAGIYMAGTAVAAGWEIAKAFTAAVLHDRAARRTALAFVVAGTAIWCAPAVNEIRKLDQRDSTVIYAQRQADITEGAAVAPIISYIKRHGGGRVYAGLGSNWGQSFTLGFVPLYKYLESQDVDEMTYVVPSLSLMLDPEAGFDENNPADFPIFGTRYILLPYGMSAPVPARRVIVSGVFALWAIRQSGYTTTVRVDGVIKADRADVGSRSLGFLATVALNQDLAVDWPGLPAPKVPAPARATATAPGTVNYVNARLGRGEMGIGVTMHASGSLLVSIAYDPGWHAYVNGRTVPTEMLAPALIGVNLGPGRYRVVLRYEGYRWYPELWLVGLLALLAVAWRDRQVPVGVQDAGASANAACMAIPTDMASSSRTIRLE